MRRKCPGPIDGENSISYTPATQTKKAMKVNFVKAAVTMGLVSSLSISSWGIITSDTVGGGELDGVSFAVNFGSVSYVSDLSTGGLRFNRGNAGIGGSQITAENLAVTRLSELSFDWSVEDSSWYRDRAFYQILDLDLEAILLHDGIGQGTADGSVIRLLNPGDYQLKVSTYYDIDDGEVDIGMYDFMLRNLRITPLDVPDSSLGFLGIASIFILFGAHRRFGGSRR